jgi:UDP-N-acetylmuramate dehydrogenase
LLRHAPSPDSKELVKVASAMILDVCGLKGFRKGDVQLNPTQPVIVLNVTGHATAEEVLALVKEVRRIVENKTGLHLYTEPELIGFSESELLNFGFNGEEIARYLA